MIAILAASSPEGWDPEGAHFGEGTARGDLRAAVGIVWLVDDIVEGSLTLWDHHGLHPLPFWQLMSKHFLHQSFRILCRTECLTKNER
jgi:hypothetical protein